MKQKLTSHVELTPSHVELSPSHVQLTPLTCGANPLTRRTNPPHVEPILAVSYIDVLRKSLILKMSVKILDQQLNKQNTEELQNISTCPE